MGAGGIEGPQLIVNGKACGLAVIRCDTFLRRALGRAAATEATRGCAWRLRRCNAIHTFFPAAPIDVAFCDAQGAVVRLIAPLARRRCAWQRGADCVWEFPAGTAQRLGLRAGDRVGSCA